MKIFNFNLIYTKFYADFRSGLRFGCYQRTFWRYLMCSAFNPLGPLSWHADVGSIYMDADGLNDLESTPDFQLGLCDAEA